MTQSQSLLTEKGKKRRRDTAIGYRFAFCQCVSGIAELFWLWWQRHWTSAHIKSSGCEFLQRLAKLTYGYSASMLQEPAGRLKPAANTLITWKKIWVHCMDINFSIMIHMSEVMKNSCLQDPELGSSRALSSVGAKRLLFCSVELGQFSRLSLPCGRKSFTF